MNQQEVAKLVRIIEGYWGKPYTQEELEVLVTELTKSDYKVALEAVTRLVDVYDDRPHNATLIKCIRSSVRRQEPANNYSGKVADKEDVKKWIGIAKDNLKQAGERAKGKNVSS